jgi:hypothetical protein
MRTLRSTLSIIQRNDLVSDPKVAVDQDICSQAAPVDERLNQRLPHEFTQVGARLAQTSAAAFDRANPEPSANELVQPDATRRHVASCLARSEPNPQRRQILDDFSFDEREISTHSAIVRVMPATEGIPIARQSLTDVCPDSKYRSHRRALNGRYVDRLDSACKRRPRADAIAGLGVLAHRVLETDGRRQRPRVDKTTAR